MESRTTIFIYAKESTVIVRDVAVDTDTILGLLASHEGSSSRRKHLQEATVL